MVDEAKKSAPPVSKIGRDRSPPYPFISLRVAVDRLAKFEQKFGRHDAPMDKLGIAWGMLPKSSQALQTAAALKSFGLVDYTGTSKERGVALSEDGRNYLRAQQDSIKTEILKRCAVKPRAIALCWSRWSSDRPPDEVCLDELILKNKFTEPAARTLLRVYDDTVAFAKLQGSDNVAAVAGLSEHDEDNDEDAVGVFERRPSGPNVGDFVRWENAGVVMFDARRVLGRSPDGEYVYVEGSRTGLPLKEIAMVEAPVAPNPLPPLSPFAATNAASASSAAPGEREWLRGPLSKEASYRLIVSGDLGSKELGKLIKLLEAQRLVLDDE